VKCQCFKFVQKMYTATGTALTLHKCQCFKFVLKMCTATGTVLTLHMPLAVHHASGTETIIARFQ
jgi:predicted nucleic-acid-binding Zn-ribbon protein